MGIQHSTKQITKTQTQLHVQWLDLSFWVITGFYFEICPINFDCLAKGVIMEERKFELVTSLLRERRLFDTKNCPIDRLINMKVEESESGRKKTV